MLVSHEVPLCLLEQSSMFNDYDYCLSHLLDENEQYKDFYIHQAKTGRQVIVDNSVFELEKSVTSDDLIRYIEMIKPSHYIIPDVLDDAEATVQNVIEWNKSIPGMRVGVVQGNTMEEALWCLNEIVDHVDVIAISFNCEFYKTVFNLDCNVMNINFAYARYTFIMYCIQLGLFSSKCIHLLGCSTPLELAAYNNIARVLSVDTSAPIMWTLDNRQMFPACITEKPNGKLYKQMEINPDDINTSLLYRNINTFKELTKTPYPANLYAKI